MHVISSFYFTKCVVIRVYFCDVVICTIWTLNVHTQLMFFNYLACLFHHIWLVFVGLCFPSVTILCDLYTTFYTIQIWSFFYLVFTFYLLQFYSYFFISISALTIVVFPMSVTIPPLTAPWGTSFKRNNNILARNFTYFDILAFFL